MCGIFGIIHADRSRRVEERTVREATDLMAHRGPDDGGYWVSENLGLGHRRLSIIDLSPSGHQPMFNEDGEVALVYNGEIYNFPEIHAELVARGHRFMSRSDTEVIVHAYEEWGFDSLKRFNGMFAFALWDARQRLLWVVRDRLGVKPLYYFFDGATFLVSSEVKPLLKTGVVPPRVNEELLDSYLSVGYAPAPQTLFKGIRKLRPGHYLTFREGRLEEQQYWDFARVEPSGETAEQAGRRLVELLSDSVGKRLISDVPVGLFLSGGLDSSVVLSLMKDLVPTPVNSFTVGYDSKVSEAPYAEQVARQHGTTHRLLKLEPEDFFDSLRTMVRYAEEPVVEPAAIALYRVSQLARENAIVLLSGEGSDELFGGYHLYRFMDRVQRAQSFYPKWAARGLARLASGSGKLNHLKYLDWVSLPLEERYQGTSSYLTESMKRRLYSPEFLARRGEYLGETFRGHFNAVGHLSDTVNRMLYVDTKTWLVDDLLLKADKMTMAASVELRVPFLDYRLVEFAISLPSSLKVASGSGKWILKKSVEERLPREIVHRKKMGFPVPIGEWFGNELFQAIREKILRSDLLPLFRPGAVEALLEAHRSRSEDHGRLIMSLLVLAIWKESFLSGKGGA